MILVHTPLLCWFCDEPLDQIKYYVCRKCIRKRFIKNIEDYIIKKKDREYYEWLREQQERFRSGTK
jgi:hypothetical protein